MEHVFFVGVYLGLFGFISSVTYEDNGSFIMMYFDFRNELI